MRKTLREQIKGILGHLTARCQVEDVDNIKTYKYIMNDIRVTFR